MSTVISILALLMRIALTTAFNLHRTDPQSGRRDKASRGAKLRRARRGPFLAQGGLRFLLRPAFRTRRGPLVILIELCRLKQEPS